MAGVKRALLALAPMPPYGLCAEFNTGFCIKKEMVNKIRAYRADCPKRRALECRIEEIRRAFYYFDPIPDAA